MPHKFVAKTLESASRWNCLHIDTFYCQPTYFINKQAVVRGTTNPAPCCHLANDIDCKRQSSELWPVITNKLTFDPPTRLPELTQNLIRSSHGHSTPSLKISCKSVQPFSRNVADKETNKERKKSPENNTPSP